MQFVSEYQIADDIAAEKIAAALRSLGILNVEVRETVPNVFTVQVPVPRGVDADVHEVATNDICNAIVEAMDSDLAQ